MRWSEQAVGEDRSGRLPGVDGAVIRSFDAPEALETRFHEVHAKSALNRVPGRSRVPFPWTINPYRGCSHACTYCAAGDTPVLLADGSHRSIADLRVGDEIYGTERVGRYRRYVKTRVLDHWSSVKPAYRTLLADGTELVTSGDHRFWTWRGKWKHVVGAMAGPLQRPHLTLNDSLVGTGRFEGQPHETVDYQRGYLCGLLRGDAPIGSYSYERPGRTHGDVHRFRLALADDQALIRAQLYLAAAAIRTDEFTFAVGGGAHRPMQAIRTQRRGNVEAIRGLIDWPVAPSEDWRRGFLAGIFDAEGSCTAGSSALRIPNTDPAILGWTEENLRRFGFDVALEDYQRHNGLKCLRLRGGLREQLRFLHLTNPAISRKRDIEGLALKSDANLRIEAIEPLGRAQRLFDITTGTGDFIANGVVSHNCFARPTHEYLDMDAGRDFEKEIIVKVNAPEVLRAELARPSWRREHVALGTNTDPYQWVEKRYRLMRGIWEALRDFRTPCSILTKSPLLLRDADLFEELVAVTSFSACLSIPTLDEKAWRATEPHTPHPRKRVEAVAELTRRGIPCGVLVAPLMPGINDSPEQVEAVVEACAQAGAARIGGQALFLRGSTKDVFMGHLREKRPDLVAMYERLYGRGSYLPKKDRERIEGTLRSRTRRVRRADPMPAARFRPPEPAAPEPVPAARHSQESLFSRDNVADRTVRSPGVSG